MARVLLTTTSESNMSNVDPIERLNSNRPPFIELLNGRVIAVIAMNKAARLNSAQPRITATLSMLFKAALLLSC